MGLPEVAFVGRSNVGKSSLINAITGCNGLARTSNTPGRTQALHFFSYEFGCVVDLPGYGYAKAPKDQVAAWQALMQAYLQGRVTLQRAFVLMDSRHGLKKPDEEMLAMLAVAAVSTQVVLTKVDKISKSAYTAVHDAVTQAVRSKPAVLPMVLGTSAEKGLGLEDVRASMLQAFGVIDNVDETSRL